MYLLHTTFLLLLVLSIKAKELDDKHKQNNNITTFLPYTLKSKLNNKDQEELKDITPNKDFAKPQEKQALSLYEEPSDIAEPSTFNHWKRLTTFLPTESPLGKHHEVTYLCKTPSYHLYEQHPTHHTSLLGNLNFPLSQMLIILIQLSIITYILLGSVSLFHRLLSLSPATVNTLSDGFNGNFYKSDLV